MSWCPFAKKMELQPESDNQAAITPTQFIVHSLAAPWSIERTYEYWRDSTNLESHFGLGYDGRLGQYIGTNTRADANAQANPRAISLESAANTENSDPWTQLQIDTLVKAMDWAAREHDIPRRKCRSWTDPGFGYHRMFPEWSTGGTACPGDARVKQFNEIVMPRLIAGDVEETVALTEADLDKIAKAVVAELLAGDKLVRELLLTDNVLKNPNSDTNEDNPYIATATALNNIEIIGRRSEALLKEIKAGLEGTA